MKEVTVRMVPVEGGGASEVGAVERVCKDGQGARLRGGSCCHGACTGTLMVCAGNRGCAGAPSVRGTGCP
jgi:hypothetical protein